jgi:hypothetical protein
MQIKKGALKERFLAIRICLFANAFPYLRMQVFKGMRKLCKLCKQVSTATLRSMYRF